MMQENHNNQSAIDMFAKLCVLTDMMPLDNQPVTETDLEQFESKAKSMGFLCGGQVKDIRTEKCSDLQKNRPVVCKIWNCAHTKQEITDASVIYVLQNRRTVCVGYMDGYHYRTDDIPYEDMIAAHDPNGPEMKFDNIRGPSVLLTAE